MNDSRTPSRFEHNQGPVDVTPSYCHLCRGDEPRCPDCSRPVRSRPSYYVPANEYDFPEEPGKGGE